MPARVAFLPFLDVSVNATPKKSNEQQIIELLDKAKHVNMSTTPLLKKVPLEETQVENLQIASNYVSENQDLPVLGQGNEKRMEICEDGHLEKKIKCTVNQESYEHQASDGWEASLCQPSTQIEQVQKEADTALVSNGTAPIVRVVSTNGSQGHPPPPCASTACHQEPVSQSPLGNVLEQVGNPMKAANTTPLVAGSTKNTSNQTRPMLTSTFDPLLPVQSDTIIALGLPAQKRVRESATIQSPSKRQKMNEDYQSIDQINDVTVASGINLMEEEQHLMAEPNKKKSGAIKVFVQEEQKFILESIPLRHKVLGIAKQYGIETISDDVDQCLSLSLEELYRGLVHKLIKFSKQRCGVGKGQQEIIVTSDVGNHIAILKKKAIDARSAKQALEQQQIDSSSIQAENAAEAKPKLQPKRQKNRQEDENFKIAATNLAVRRAFGADDMLLKWQMMAEEARIRRESGEGLASSDASRFSSKANSKGPGGSLTDAKENGSITAMRKSSLGPSSFADSGRPPGKKFPKSESVGSNRLITVKDLIGVLEMHPHLSKSPLLYRLYNRNTKQ